MSTKKYRPYFTFEELKILRDSSTSHPNLHKYLYRYISDIENGVRQENHTLLPTLIEQLNVPSKSPIDSSGPALYQLYRNNKHSSAGFSPRQIEILAEFRYSAGLMNEEEEQNYEAKLFTSK